MGRKLKSRRYVDVTGGTMVGHTMSRIGNATNYYADNTKNYLLKPMHPIDLGSLKINDKREKNRLQAGGVLIIHDLFRKKQFKVRIRNFSIGGLCCEIDSSGSAILGSEVMVEFVGEISKAGLDVVKSKVMWVTPLHNSPEKSLLIGLEFSNEISATKLRKIKDFVETLRNEI